MSTSEQLHPSPIFSNAGAMTSSPITAIERPPSQRSKRICRVLISSPASRDFTTSSRARVRTQAVRPTAAGRPRTSGETSGWEVDRRYVMTLLIGMRRCPPAVLTEGMMPRSHQRFTEDSLTSIAFATCRGVTRSSTGHLTFALGTDADLSGCVKNSMPLSTGFNTRVCKLLQMNDLRPRFPK